MTDSRAEEILRRQEALAADRQNFDNLWQEAAEYVLPRQAVFTRQRSPGEEQGEQVFDDTAPFALERFAGAIQSVATPPTDRWHRLALDLPDDMLEAGAPAAKWLDAVTDRLFRARYAPQANFVNQSLEAYMSLGAFGTAGLYVTEDPGRGLRYQARHLKEFYLAEDAVGRVDTVHRAFELTARQANQRWGDKLPAAILRTMQKAPDQKFPFVHCVKPGVETDSRWPLASYYVSVEGKALLSEGGYRTMPYAIGRYVQAPGEVYGRGPGVQGLRTLRVLNQMVVTLMMTAEKAADPPLLTHDDDVLQAFMTVPGYINRGGVSADGKPLVQPLLLGSNLPVNMEIIGQYREIVNAAFLVTLFQILVEDRTQMTATEVLYRQQEKGALLAPAMGRLQSEFLGPLIERELDILAEAGQIPPPPPEVLQYLGQETQDGQVVFSAAFRPEYESPFTRMQRAQDGLAILRTLESITPLAQFNPAVLDAFDADEMVRVLAKVNGLPSKVLRSVADVKASRNVREQADKAKALLEAASVGSMAAKNAAQAQQALGQTGQAPI